ncbi:hypothetical protein D5086_023613 [Populus alba]|uniref:Uncharacterized protein n=1 Tax=Populus alba TaxID=43335 RepID=A0ACC4BBT5_POPAL
MEKMQKPFSALSPLQCDRFFIPVLFLIESVSECKLFIYFSARGKEQGKGSIDCSVFLLTYQSGRLSNWVISLEPRRIESTP